MLWSHSSYLTNLTLDNRTGSDLIERIPTKIGKGCFIAGPAVIYPGVTIGDRCMILPMSVVTKDVPSMSLVAGSPAVVKREISEEFIKRQAETMRSKKK
jgi:acetyltransferase-like isoleucine patch superfamily enzyme